MGLSYLSAARRGAGPRRERGRGEGGIPLAAAPLRVIGLPDRSGFRLNYLQVILTDLRVTRSWPPSIADAVDTHPPRPQPASVLDDLRDVEVGAANFDEGAETQGLAVVGYGHRQIPPLRHHHGATPSMRRISLYRMPSRDVARPSQ